MGACAYVLLATSVQLDRESVAGKWQCFLPSVSCRIFYLWNAVPFGYFGSTGRFHRILVLLASGTHTRHTRAISISFELENPYLYIMTVEQKKISLINWIANLEDEVVLDQIAGIQKLSLDELPGAIVELLKIADSELEDSLTSHTSVRDLLK